LQFEFGGNANPAKEWSEMKKRIIIPHPTTEVRNDHWLDLGTLADVEVTSEAQSHPIERAIVAGEQGGWRASGSGNQRSGSCSRNRNASHGFC